MRRFSLILLFLLTMLLPLAGEEKMNCYLLTVGPGEALYSWFGHTGIIIEEGDESRFYDFGNFSFESESFYKNFAMGRLIYLKIGVSGNAYLNFIVRENRDVTVQQLNIPQDKIREMRDNLEKNTLPENNTYLYHHYRDNCSTRPRDIINKALDGQLKTVSSIPSGESYRTMFRSRTSHSFFPDWLLSMLQGRSIDEGITYWDTMFLPDELMRQLDELTVDLDGVTESVVLEKAVIAESSSPRVIPDKVPSNGFEALFFGLAAGVLFLILQWMSGSSSRAAVISGKISFTVIMTAVSLFGLLFYFITFFTDHDVARQNINILLIHPFYIIPAVSLIRNRMKNFFIFWKVQQVLWLLMLIINLIFWHQENLRTAVFFELIILINLLGQYHPVFLKSGKSS
ncbi:MULTISPECIES: DUF4105 domain-containing protein [unclassified Oceanispirochaeta]|uniref:lipoprotein N-acyltransferase Lnb domain-containing protein n=1 Tax=unclassified Oceanispirochaeta TaxID=2635722 RepID=UPI00131439E0|nr:MULTISPECIES: DUF4105 domain-containing protein [unclassified Oceanispirochaeta]MBF9014907.1 DUF4105 domain-containing protein [Oceanispirochaeta sp. M2]NPD71412.1 DUF4105 domain-containing protein [Oceanispirochaeta sp. M1]